MYSVKKGFIIPIISAGVLFLTLISVSAGIFDDMKIPEKTIIIRFKDASPLPKKLPIFFKGLKIGKTVSQEFSEDYKYTLLNARIDKKDFNPPNNVYAEIKYETQAQIQGTKVDINKYLDLNYPENPSSEPLKDGDIIEGRKSYVNKVEEAFKESAGKNDIKSTIDNVVAAADEARKASSKISEISDKVNEFLAANRTKFDEIVENSRQISGNANYVSRVVKDYSAKPLKEKGLQAALDDLPEITDNVSRITFNAGNISEDFSYITRNRCFRNGVVNTAANTARITNYIDYSLKYGDLKAILTDTDRTINRLDCFEEGLSDMLSKRFLLLRMIFGKPGDAFERCEGPFPQYEYTKNTRTHCCPYCGR